MSDAVNLSEQVETLRAQLTFVGQQRDSAIAEKAEMETFAYMTNRALQKAMARIAEIEATIAPKPEAPVAE